MIREENVYQYFIVNATHITKLDSFSHRKYELNKYLNCWEPAKDDYTDSDTFHVSSHDVYLIRLADDIAHEAHKDQKDRGGHEYILHPVSVSNLIKSDYPDHVTEQIVALLHDTVEDTGITLDDLSKTFNEKVIEALDSVTHRKTESYDEYMKRLEKNPIARAVKRADLTNNSDLSRIPEPSEKDYKRVQKYKHYIEELDQIDSVEDDKR